jgi:hypothetical protein
MGSKLVKFHARGKWTGKSSLRQETSSISRVSRVCATPRINSQIASVALSPDMTRFRNRVKVTKGYGDTGGNGIPMARRNRCKSCMRLISTRSRCEFGVRIGLYLVVDSYGGHKDTLVKANSCKISRWTASSSATKDSSRLRKFEIRKDLRDERVHKERKIPMPISPFRLSLQSITPLERSRRTSSIGSPLAE